MKTFLFYVLSCYLCTSHLKAPQPSIRTLAGDWGGGGGDGLSPQIHSMLVPRKVGNSMEVTVFASPTKGISGALLGQQFSFSRLIVILHTIIVALIVHIFQSVLTITINICQYLVSLSRKYFCLLLWNAHLYRTDLIDD